MLTQISPELRNRVLIEFTKELILNSRTPELIAIEQILIAKRKETSERRILKIQPLQINPAKQILRPQQPRIQVASEWQQSREIKTISNPKQENFENIFSPGEFSSTTPRFEIQPILGPVRIPEPIFPERLRYIQPAPNNIEISLGRLDQIMKDPIVRAIECNGPNTTIVVRNPNQKMTDINLTKEEINEIIKRFSDIARIPLNEGVIRIAAGKYILAAIYSEMIGSKFIIRKMQLFGQNINQIQNHNI